MQHHLFICTQSNGSKVCDVISIIHFRYPVKEFQVLLFNTNNPIPLYFLIGTLLKGFKYCCVLLTNQLHNHLNGLKSVKWPKNLISSNSIHH